MVTLKLSAFIREPMAQASTNTERASNRYQRQTTESPANAYSRSTRAELRWTDQTCFDTNSSSSIEHVFTAASPCSVVSHAFDRLPEFIVI
jgi:hypothetical protein